jgi:hypothetical protein
LQAHSRSHHQAICGCFFPRQWFIKLIVGNVVIPSSSLLVLLIAGDVIILSSIISVGPCKPIADLIIKPSAVVFFRVSGLSS